ncbi:mannose-1-phosphate guanylyltransferase/mannose-6-phosphate isomerase [Methanothermococcus okinawensis]|uniref:mannose-1-phosphate guanylyltransferase n=1 Tax=Methanothermococcus okinawensis (strain DSM 14208 / JCM 11175 / IH1) TaxID=647113 RepID=F8AK14_METOI|nr:mannose-1-phosphate guanylyltransferase/mannose-6-phosphate isomerase [Methanothermococcus okinawensis]AEH07374.1 mannose-1-phosphate guanylyltransferase/mannose-6-phosphate isomerase [Methanothermococcus okinawensis IH1]
MKSIILAGGVGSRLWPLSREYYPKQFIKFKSFKKSLFQMTFERCLALSNNNLDDIYIVTNEKHKFLVLGQIEELGYNNFNEDNILIEPIGKNTLPAIYYGVKVIKNKNNNNENDNNKNIVGVFPSDHLIDKNDEELFINTIMEGKKIAKDYLITFGITPTKPHTGYGYIKPLKKLNIGYTVDEFKEKPDLKTAEKYIKNGYLWNSGMFLFDADLFEEEVKTYKPELYELFKSDDINEVYNNVPDISIDYGIMEKSKNVAVIPLNIKWNDLGSFDAFYDEFKTDDAGNIVHGENLFINSKNNLINTENNKFTSLIDVNDLIVVDTRDALMICKKGSSQKIKEVFNTLKRKNDERVLYHKTVYRPWGSYTILDEGKFYKIKRITVLPGKKLSYQLHHHRSEHWIVVKGMAKVVVDDKEYFVRNGESTFVKSGLKHRLENPGKIPLEVIEAQIGEYLEEDDIIRFNDDWGRK